MQSIYKVGVRVIFGGFSDYAVNDLVVVKCDRLAEFSDLRHGFSTRIGGASSGCFDSLNLSFGRGDGDSAVHENYARFAAACGLSANAYAYTHQIHENCVRPVGPADVFAPAPGVTAPECDGIVTAAPGVPLLGKSADCVPILLYCPSPRICAFAHAGWRGTAAAIAAKAVDAMCDAGAKPENIIAAVGPSISKCCFLCHSDVTDAMGHFAEEITSGSIEPAADGRFAVDLKRINGAILDAAGVGEVYVSTECTCCMKEKYYSHRRTGAARGSMAAVIEMI